MAMYLHVIWGQTIAAIAFDTLKAARRLKEVGVPEAQAEAQAELMAGAFVYNLDSLASKDFIEASLDARFARQDARTDVQFNEIKGHFRLTCWMLAVVIAGTIIPSLSSFFGN